MKRNGSNVVWGKDKDGKWHVLFSPCGTAFDVQAVVSTDDIANNRVKVECPECRAYLTQCIVEDV